MSEAGPGANGAPMDDEGSDDQRWFELMAGRSSSDVRPGTRTEAAWLRAALLAYSAAPPVGAMPDPSERVQQLLVKARCAGVLKHRSVPSAVAARSSPWAWLRQPPFAGGAVLAVAALLSVVALRVTVPPTTPPDVERGAALQHLVAADPAARQQALLRTLRAAGLDAQPYERLGRLGVDVALPVPLPPPQAAALTALGLRPPVGPSLRVEIILPVPEAGSGSPP